MVPRAVGFRIVWPEGVIFGSIMTYHVQFLLLVRQPLFDRAALPLTQTSWVLPPLSVGKMTLRLYSALNYSHGLSKGQSFGTGRDQKDKRAASKHCIVRRRRRNQCLARVLQWPRGLGRKGYEGRPNFPKPSRLWANSQEETHALGCSKGSVQASTKRCSNDQRPEVGAIPCHHDSPTT